MYFSSLRLIAVNISSNHRLLRKIFIFLACAVAALSILSPARAVSPPPDGGYSNFNTAEGDNALLNLTTGNNNTALSSNAILGNNAGSHNTATSSDGLHNNTSGRASNYVSLEQ